jgi:translation initiation factor IF-2
MENKKTKLTISGIAKKSIENIELAKTQSKNSVIIEKKPTRFSNRGSFSRPTSTRTTDQKLGFQGKKPGVLRKPSLSKTATPITSDYEKRKLAEQRATRRLKGESTVKDSKGKIGSKKRELKLTVSRALSDEIETRTRSLASLKRARQKENRDLTKEEIKENLKPIKRDVNIPETITVRELANRMAEQSSAVIKFLLGMGVTVTINQSLAADTAEYIVNELGHNPIRETKTEEIIKKIKETRSENLKNRPPIVTVMGHVDHGKTSVLDVLRSTNVVSGEFGGITQHIGAYQIEHKKNKLTFIDTPGHAAFTEMRARGSKLTDVVVLVVAADDGVKPQTIESIKHAKAAKVPIVVAINKCDLPEADPQKIKNQLLEHELIAEDLSGDTLMVEISTKTKKNLDKLVESIVLQAEILDLKTDFDSKATGVVLESKIDTGRGPIATVIITSGTLKKGDYFVSGLKWGKARAIINDLGKNINEALPASPVEILGINGAAKAGDDFLVLDNEKEVKSLAEARVQETKDGKNPLTFATQESAFKDKISEELNIIIKSDVHGSSEAIKGAISQIKHDEVKPNIILSDIGMITETDVTLAKASNAVLIAFNVKPTKEAKNLAEREKITISSYNIIYEVLDFIKKRMSGLLSPNISEQILGSAEILEIFKVSNAGKVAGSKIIEGEVLSTSNARLIRDGAIIYTGKIATIFREKNQVKQVSTGQECGITLKDFNDYQKKDIIEVFNSTSTQRVI